MAREICLLNRKPYRDKDGNLRQRYKCCGRKDDTKPCLLTKQPDGEVIIWADTAPRRPKPQSAA